MPRKWRGRRAPAGPGSEFLHLNYGAMDLPELGKQLGHLYGRPCSNTIRERITKDISRQVIANLEGMEKAGVDKEALLGFIRDQREKLLGLRAPGDPSNIRRSLTVPINALTGLYGRVLREHKAAGGRMPEEPLKKKTKRRDFSPALPEVERVPEKPRQFKRRQGFVFLGEQRGRDVWVRLSALEGMLKGIPERDRLRALREYELPQKERSAGKPEGKQEKPKLGNLARHALFKAKTVYEKEFGKRPDRKSPDTIALLKYIEQKGKPL